MQNEVRHSIGIHPNDAEVFISATREECEGIEQPYPCIKFGDLTIFPNDSQMRELHAKLGLYIDALPVAEVA